MSSWYHQYPKTKRSDDLIGTPLMLLAEYPPQDTQFGGMKTLILELKGDNTKRFRVMMTTQDIDKAVELYVNNGVFTFAKPKDTKHAFVVEYAKESGKS